jgi:hypothetical protein
MVRVWHPTLVDVLDDNRILAAHAETHYIQGALTGKHQIWWRHPETQRFYDRDGYIELCHDLIVREMRLRGFNHKTPMAGERTEEHHLMSWANSCQDAFGDHFDWYHQDVADLCRKWEKERRWESVVEDGNIIGHRFNAGLLVKGEFKAAKPRVLHVRGEQFLLSRGWPSYEMFHTVERKHPHRDWTRKDTLRLRETMNREARTQRPLA